MSLSTVAEQANHEIWSRVRFLHGALNNGEPSECSSRNIPDAGNCAHRLARSGVVFASHAVYPTFTDDEFASISLTGTYPGVHGFFGNAWRYRAVAKGKNAKGATTSPISYWCSSLNSSARGATTQGRLTLLTMLQGRTSQRGWWLLFGKFGAAFIQALGSAAG